MEGKGIKNLYFISHSITSIFSIVSKSRNSQFNYWLIANLLKASRGGVYRLNETTFRN